MNKILSILMVLALTMSCKGQTNTDAAKGSETNKADYISVGMQIDDKDASSVSQMATRYQSLKEGDTLNLKMTAKVDEVCQMKGCWMTLNLEDGNQVRVTFKDYGFFVPKDIAGKEVIVNGKAFVEETSVKDQKHFAEDAGKSPEEIAAITAPKLTYSFEADGVLIKE